MIAPWNFPIAIPAWKMAPALISGNTVVFKPAWLTPLIGIKLVEVLEEAGMPKGVVNIVSGSGSVIGDELVAHSDVDAISFTGSYQVGCGIGQRGAESLKRVQLEMGGKNPVVVLEDADLDKAAEIAARGGFAVTARRVRHRVVSLSSRMCSSPSYRSWWKRLVLPRWEMDSRRVYRWVPRSINRSWKRTWSTSESDGMKELIWPPEVTI